VASDGTRAANAAEKRSEEGRRDRHDPCAAVMRQQRR
jgi:hypothetical protein